jgi:hypothetical protein
MNPIGVGTFNIESLTSYVTRLSSAHNITLGVLFTKIIYPFLEKENFPRDGIKANKSSAFNNFHYNSNELVYALTNLTTIKNLENLTLINFNSFLSDYEVRSTKYWCPLCFQDCRNNKSPIYEKLLWSFEVVEVCFEHRCKLVNSCPSCNNIQYHMTRSGRTGHCYICDTYLGLTDCRKYEELPQDYIVWQKWIIENIKELLILNQQERVYNNKKWINYGENIEYIINLIANNYGIKKNDIFKVSNIPRRLYSYWKNGQRKASLYSVLKLGYVTSISLNKFFSHEEYIMGEKIRRLPQYIYQNNLYKNQKKYEINELKEELRRVIIKNEDKNNPPLSLSQITKILGYKKTETLRKKLPHETEIIVNKYKEYINEKNIKMKDDLRSIIIKLMNDGITPSSSNIEEELKKPKFFWKNSHREILSDLLEELGVVKKSK